ncbi:MAG: LapA family protein [Desulfobacteraceae bacterium]|nr:LapA family protein [Desulfobacteraceae bacterium]
MKKVKIAFWLILLVFAGVFAYQNKIYFMAKQNLSLTLPFLETLHTPELPHAVLFLVFFLTGFLIAYFSGLYDRFKSKKTLKNLNAAAADQQNELAALKRELESLRGASPGGSTASAEQSTKQTT